MHAHVHVHMCLCVICLSLLAPFLPLLSSLCVVHGGQHSMKVRGAKRGKDVLARHNYLLITPEYLFTILLQGLRHLNSWPQHMKSGRPLPIPISFAFHVVKAKPRPPHLATDLNLSLVVLYTYHPMYIQVQPTCHLLPLRASACSTPFTPWPRSA